MTAYRRIALASLLLVIAPAVGACQQPDAAATKPASSDGKAAVHAPLSFERETKAFSFSYEYPAEAAAIPALAALLNAERTKGLTDLEASAAQDMASASAEGYPFNPHMAGVAWKVTGDTGTVLAMLGEITSFSGGAHGNSNYDALLWDKAAAKRITLDALFTNPAAAMEPLRQPYCDALNVERIEKRGQYEATGDDMFEACPPFTELVIVPYAGSSEGFDRLMLLAAPYVAGPYAEGAYEISLPITAATLNQVKPEYRMAFGEAAR